ncbi:hypothetical protein [Actinoplanes sp. CA-252034]|uniref:hypothetical protein n=1 Tax=Actinoplanes sp. CA-252034 TaxID=3239906 RepID=UPI003D964039
MQDQPQLRGEVPGGSQSRDSGVVTFSRPGGTGLREATMQGLKFGEVGIEQFYYVGVHGEALK